LSRFKNTALKDTVHRVGRDLRRKLSRDDRLAGAMLLCAKHGLPFNTIAGVYRAALDFAAPGEDGALFPPDAQFREEYGLNREGEPAKETLSLVLCEVSALNKDDPVDSLVIGAI
jgi:mannitol-1-phosphate 5-dehydrogenase